MSVTVYADDLSGANTVAALFHKRGWQARVHLNRVSACEAVLESQAESSRQVHVYNMGTRNGSEEAAAVLFRETAFAMGGVLMGHVVAFRIDSTLRGPIAASMGALLAVYPDHIALVVPAYPDSGRTTRAGIHYVHGTPVHETPVGNDPFAPVPVSDLRVCIGDRSRHPFVHLSLELIRGHQEPAFIFLRAAIDTGVRVVLCDAETNDDIDALASLATLLSQSGDQVLPVDPGPFSVSFATHLLTQSTEAGPVVLGISASIMHNARVQMDYLEHTLGLGLVHYHGQPADEVIAQMRQLTLMPSRTGTAVPISSATTLFLRTDTWNLEPAQAASVVERLPDIITAATQAFPSLRGFYFSGGEAAATILTGVGVSTLAMEMEVAPLTTMSRPLDGLLCSTYVVTKGGAIGDERAVVDALVRLHEVAHRSS